MKHLSSVLLAAALVAAGVTACFKDNQAPLRNGATRIELTRTAITLRTGDSLAIQAELKDEQGNVLNAAGVQWATDNAAVATVRVDAIPIPGPAFSRGFVLATGAAGGVAHITVTGGGLTNSFRVLVLPARLTANATAAVTGTTSTDTIVNVLPGGVIQNDIFTRGDTVTFTMVTGSALSFGTTGATASVVHFGAATASIVARSATAIKVVSTAPYRGRPWVTNLTYAGPAEVGNIALDSLQSDTVIVARQRFRGTVTQTADTMFVNAPTGATFSATASGVSFGATAGIVLSRTTSLLKAISPANYTGPITVSNVTIGLATVSLTSSASYTISKASFGGTTSAASYNLLDTVKVYGTAVTKFTTTPAASVSNVSMNGVAAFVLLRTADSMYVIAKRTSTGPLAVSNVNVGGTNIPTLNTPSNVLVGPTTGEANEPGNELRATATPIAFTGATDTITIYASLDCEDDGTACPGNGDLTDYFSIVFAGGQNLKGVLTFMGTGNPGSGYNDSNNPDVDVCFRNATSYLGTCTGTNGAGLNMPETATTAVVGGLVADTYWYRVMAWVTPSPIVYQLKIIRIP